MRSGCGRLHILHLGRAARIVQVDQHGDCGGVRYELMQQSEPLWSECPEHEVHARHVVARPVEAGHETQLDRVAAARKHNRDRRRCGLRTASGVKLMADPLPRAAAIDTLLIPGGPGIHVLRKDRRALATLRRLCARSRRVCAICTGAFALAEIGLLDKCRVVTHWRSCAQLAEEFPEICVDPEPLFIQAGKVWTTAGVTAGIDLSLALSEQDHSAALATSVARRLVVYMKRPGG